MAYGRNTNRRRTSGASYRRSSGGGGRRTAGRAVRRTGGRVRSAGRSAPQRVVVQLQIAPQQSLVPAAAEGAFAAQAKTVKPKRADK